MPSWPRPFGNYPNPASGIGSLGLSTVVDFEKQRRQVSSESAESIGRALVTLESNSSTKRSACVGVAEQLDGPKSAEDKTSLTIPNNSAIRSVLPIGESLAGVEFIDENGGGPGVRLRKRQRQKPRK